MIFGTWRTFRGAGAPLFRNPFDCTCFSGALFLEPGPRLRRKACKHKENRGAVCYTQIFESPSAFRGARATQIQKPIRLSMFLGGIPPWAWATFTQESLQTSRELRRGVLHIDFRVLEDLQRGPSPLTQKPIRLSMLLGCTLP